MPLTTHLRQIATHNLSTLCACPLSELSGSLGDLGTLLPLLLALSLTTSISLPATLVFSGLANILTGAVYGIPLPVQPMKAIASIAIASNFSREETTAAGLSMGVAVLVLSVTGCLGWLHRVVPVPVVKGVQVGAGLALVLSAGEGILRGLGWTGGRTGENLLWVIAAFGGLVVAGMLRRFPFALVVCAVGFGVAIMGMGGEENGQGGFWRPDIVVPAGPAWKRAIVEAAVPQLPLTTLNSVLAVVSLAGSLFPDYPPTPSTTSIGLSVAISNLVGCWFGAMPMCHGSGGLAGQYRFGARSGASIIILGLVKLLLGLFVGEAILPVLRQFPKSLLGVMVLAAGVELAKVAQSVGDSQDLWEQVEEEHEASRAVEHRDKLRAVEQKRDERWIVMTITVAGCLAFKNDAVGFIAGLIWHWAYRAPDWVDRVRQSRRSVRLLDDPADNTA